MANLSESLNQGAVSKKLLYLVYLRVSQIDGCAYCTQLHTGDLRKQAETPDRLDTLATWKESPYFTPEERIALRWAEAVTFLREQEAPQALFDELKTCYTDAQIAEMTFAIAAINAWDPVAVSMRRPV